MTLNSIARIEQIKRDISDGLSFTLISQKYNISRSFVMLLASQQAIQKICED